MNNQFMNHKVMFYDIKIPNEKPKYCLGFEDGNLKRCDIKSFILLGYLGYIPENTTHDQCEIIAFDTINKHERVWLQALIDTTNVTITIIDRAFKKKTTKLNVDLPIFDNAKKDEYIEKFVISIMKAFENKIEE